MRAAIAIAIVVVGGAAPALAEPAPRAPQVLHAPTAWVQPRDVVHGEGGVDHRGGGFLRVTGGLAGLADVDLGVSDREVTCDPCDGERRATPASIAGAGLKVRAWSAPRAAVAVGLRRSIAGRDAAPALAEAFAVASIDLGLVRVHAGGAATRATGMATSARPLAGLDWTPPQYPKTTVLADLAWAPEAGPDRTAMRWVAGWGVRYQALAWGSIELAVRHREGEGLSGSTVLVRVAGVLRLR